MSTRRGDRPGWIGRGMVAAIVLAPFLALRHGPDAGLVVAAAALSITSWAAWERTRAVPAGARPMKVAACVNALLAASMIVLLALRRFD